MSKNINKSWVSEGSFYWNSCLKAQGQLWLAIHWDIKIAWSWLSVQAQDSIYYILQAFHKLLWIFFIPFYLFPSAFSHVFWPSHNCQNTCETLQEIISSNRLQLLEKLSVRCFLLCFFLRENEQWHVHTLKTEAGTLILFPEVKTESRSKRRELQQCDWHGQMSAPWYIFFLLGGIKTWWNDELPAPTSHFSVHGKKQQIQASRYVVKKNPDLRQMPSSSLTCFRAALLPAGGYEPLSRYTSQCSTWIDLQRHFNGLL